MANPDFSLDTVDSPSFCGFIFTSKTAVRKKSKSPVQYEKHCTGQLNNEMKEKRKHDLRFPTLEIMSPKNVLTRSTERVYTMPIREIKLGFVLDFLPRLSWTYISGHYREGKRGAHIRIGPPTHLLTDLACLQQLRQVLPSFLSSSPYLKFLGRPSPASAETCAKLLTPRTAPFFLSFFSPVLHTRSRPAV